MTKTSVVIPNWNGAKAISGCLDSLVKQTLPSQTIVVDNGSTDRSLAIIRDEHPDVDLIALPKNKGFAGGVNVGIKRAIENGSKYVALLNNDAVADKAWLKSLVDFMEDNQKAGIATSKMLNGAGKRLDSTGEAYTIWGLPYPRGREESRTDKYDQDIWIFGASGGASIYRIKMLKEIGLFDEDFFAYYEDVDLSFRAQLAGWKVAYAPKAVVYHQIGATSSRIQGFITYQTIKNLPWLFWKNIPPGRIFLKVLLRFELAYTAFIIKAIARGQVWAVVKGLSVYVILWPKKIWQRIQIQRRKKVSNDYIWDIITHDLPPGAHNLRKLRGWWWRLTGKGS
ncbi:MAG TPA: glycosyltransferase family 2 protein [Candidatus Saccharimonadales bacterium]|nr:glycosyltransferase family 2 protein [Candidatus Saccharimonadales bacterium]